MHSLGSLLPRLLPDIIEAGLQHPVSALTLVMQLPPSNFFTLQVRISAGLLFVLKGTLHT